MLKQSVPLSVGFVKCYPAGSIMLEIESNLLLAFGKHWTLGNLFFNTFTKDLKFV